MRCIYCDSSIDKINLISLFLKEDVLCSDCRRKMKINKAYIKLNNIKIETLFNYDEGIFKDLLIQYKECYDEALAPTFLYLLEEYIKIKYFGYKIMFVPSSIEKSTLRGFNHLQLIFKNVRLKTINGLLMKEELIQEGKDFKQRSKMVDNYVYRGEKLDKVLIVDDVITTGSSVLGVYNAIKPHANKVKVLVLARKENAFILKNKCV